MYVLARVLRRLAEPEPWTRSRLQAAVRLNYTLYSRYEAFALERGWAVLEGGRLAITAEGRQALHEMEEWLRRLLGESRL